MSDSTIISIRPRQFLNWAVATLAIATLGCGGSSNSSSTDDRIVEGVDLTELFAAPTEQEKSAVIAEWDTRSHAAVNVQILAEDSLSLGSAAATIHVVSHTVGTATHVGAVISPDDAATASLPIVVYLHGGDNGVDVDDLLDLLPLALEENLDDFVYVVPSFRSEDLRYDGSAYSSTGDASPWDRDVDDVLSLIDVALELAPAGDPERIGVVGFSRGACVGMLAGIRDPRIDLVIEFFGPTDFFSPFTEELVADALTDSLPDMPGLATLNDKIIQPLKEGELAIAAVRLDMLRRSPAYFVDRLPPAQGHHGTADQVVPVSEGQRLSAAFVGAGLSSADYTVYFYTGGGHNPVTLFGSFGRVLSFLARLTNPTLIAVVEGESTAADEPTLVR